jgi:hypothetical protein
MADWLPSPEEAKAVAGGFFGSSAHLYIERPKRLLQGLARLGIGMGSAWLLTKPVVSLTGFASEMVAFAIGLTCIAIAKRALVAADRFVFNLFRKGD